MKPFNLEKALADAPLVGRNYWRFVMTEFKGTSGPWKVDKELSSRSGEWLISKDAGSRGRGIAIAETRSGTGCELDDARLIAAAPELLEALQNMTRLYYGEDRQNQPGQYARAAVAAIAKALGETT